MKKIIFGFLLFILSQNIFAISPYSGTPNVIALFPLPSSGDSVIGYGDNIVEGGRTLIKLTQAQLRSILALDTDAVPEGSTNLYFTNARAVSALSSALALKANLAGGNTFTGTNIFSSTISGNINGNAATVTTNANLTGPVTSVGNATTVTSASITNAMLAGSIAFSKLIGTDIVITESQVTNLVSDLALKANDSTVVHNTGNETISGIKTFNSTIVGSVSGNAATVTTNAVTTLSGDATGSGANAIAVTLAPVATPGTSPKVTFNSKGLVTSGSALSMSDVITGLGYTPVNKAGDSLSGSLTFSSGTVTGLAAPTAATDAATKNYVDGVLTGLNWKSAVLAATTANITLSGTQTIDGISVVATNRVLVKNQSTTSQNGIYLVASGAWTRSLDTDTASELDGAAVYVTGGTVNGDTGWTETATITTIGTDPVVFAQFSGAGTYTNGAGLALTGNVFSIPTSGVTSSMLAGTIPFSKLIGSDIVITESQVTNLVTDLAAKANDSAVVHNTGNETIAGTKTFSSTISGSVSGNAATVTTNANLTGPVTSVGNATTVTSASITNTMLAGAITFAKLVGSDIVIAESQVTNLVTDLAARALDSAVVHNTGNETIAGTKTFSSTIAGSVSGNAATVTTNATTTFTGDATGSGANSVALTLANTAVTPAAYGSATTSPTYTVDSKGRLTAATAVTITPAFASLTSKPTTLAGYGITDAVSTSTALSGDISGNYNATVLASVGTAGTYTTITTDAKGRVTAGTMLTESNATRTIQTVAAAANGWQLSATRASMATYSVRIAVGINIQGDVVIEVNPANTAVAAAWIEKGRISNGQSGGLAEPTHNPAFQISAVIPAGSFVRIRSINVAGAPTYTYLVGQEVLY